MEREKLVREQEEKEKAEKAKKMKESFGDASSQWEKDKTELQNIALREKKKEAAEASKEKSSAENAVGDEKEDRKDAKRQDRRKIPGSGMQVTSEER